MKIRIVSTLFGGALSKFREPTEITGVCVADESLWPDHGQMVITDDADQELLIEMTPGGNTISWHSIDREKR